jgi:hypothetical protein
VFEQFEAIGLRGIAWGRPDPCALHVPAARCAPASPAPLLPVSQKVKIGVDSVEGCEATIFQVGGLGC